MGTGLVDVRRGVCVVIDPEVWQDYVSCFEIGFTNARCCFAAFVKRRWALEEDGDYSVPRQYPTG